MALFLQWTGGIFWVVFGFIGFVWFIDQGIEWFLNSMKLKRAFLEWYWERLKQRDKSILGE